MTFCQVGGANDFPVFHRKPGSASYSHHTAEKTPISKIGTMLIRISWICQEIFYPMIFCPEAFSTSRRAWV